MCVCVQVIERKKENQQQKTKTDRHVPQVSAGGLLVYACMYLKETSLIRHHVIQGYV